MLDLQLLTLPFSICKSPKPAVDQSWPWLNWLTRSDLVAYTILSIVSTRSVWHNKCLSGILSTHTYLHPTFVHYLISTSQALYTTTVTCLAHGQQSQGLWLTCYKFLSHYLAYWSCAAGVPPTENKATIDLSSVRLN